MSEQHPLALHAHAPAPHPTVNANHLHREELAQANIIDKAIMWINDKTATVQGIILFTGIGVCSLVGFLTGNIVLASIFGALSSYVLQLVYLALLMYAGKKSDRAREIQSDQIYKFGQNTDHHMRESMRHLDAQDAELLKQTTLLTQQEDMIAQLLRSQIALAGQQDTLYGKVDALATPPQKTPSAQTRDDKGRFTKAAPAVEEGAA